MKSRIKQVRKEKDLTQQEFADRIGIKRGAIANYEIGRNVPTDSVISLICREFNVNENWLRTGKGDMFVPVDRYSEISKFLNQLQHEDDNSFKNRLISVLADLNVEEWEFLENRLKQLYEGKSADNNTMEVHNQTTEELEAEYKKSVLNSAKRKASIASSTTADTDSEKQASNQ